MDKPSAFTSGTRLGGIRGAGVGIIKCMPPPYFLTEMLGVPDKQGTPSTRFKIIVLQDKGAGYSVAKLTKDADKH